MKKTCIWESRNSSKVLLQRIFLNLRESTYSFKMQSQQNCHQRIDS